MKTQKPSDGSAEGGRLDYHLRLAAAQRIIASGVFGRVEIAMMFAGKAEMPMQIAIRDMISGRIRLLDLHGDGSLMPST